MEGSGTGLSYLGTLENGTNEFGGFWAKSKTARNKCNSVETSGVIVTCCHF